jgi:hypothetical protein
MSFVSSYQTKNNNSRDSGFSTPSILHSSSPHRINNLNRDSSDSIFWLPQAIRNQAVQRLMRSNTEGFDFAKIGIVQPKLKVSQPGDEFEQEADRVAEQVMRMSTSDDFVGPMMTPKAEHIDRKCATCKMKKEEEKVAQGTSRRPTSTTPLEATDEITHEHNYIRSSDGSSLDPDAKKFMESHFGYDFSNIRIHTGETSARSANSIGALAYTIGNNIVFDKDMYKPNTVEGRRLIAHELTHTVQQSHDQLLIQRAPNDSDKVTAGRDQLCDTFDFDTANRQVLAVMKVYLSSKTSDDRLILIRALKMIRRCASNDQQQAVKNSISVLGNEATQVWDEAGKPLGGFIGMYPGFASDIRRRLVKLGASETLEYGTFELSSTGRTYRSRAKTTASRELADLGRTDIVYFRGHQFAQYKAPGVFTDDNFQRGFDLRYIEQKGGFPNVKVMISTSCATLCKEPFELFHGLFPKAVILGYRKSAPIDGNGVRDAFHKGIIGLRRPLLLDQPVDISSILSVWKAVIESKHKRETAPSPGYYDGTTLHYWDGTTWHSIAPSDPANRCRLKGDESSAYPAP